LKAAGVEDVRDGITITCCDLRKLDRTMTAAPVERTHANAIRLVPHVTQTVLCSNGHEMTLLHGPPTDPAYRGRCGFCDGGGRNGCRRSVNAEEGYYHCDPCQGDSCRGCIPNPNPELEGDQFTLEPMADEANCCSQIKNACSRMEWCTEIHILALLFLIPSSMVALTVLLLTYTDTSAFLAFLPCTIVLCALWGFGCVSFTTEQGCANGWFRMCTDRIKLEYFIPWLGCTTWLSFVVFLITFPLALDGSIPNNTSGDWAIAFTSMWIWAFMITAPFLPTDPTYRGRCVFVMVVDNFFPAGL
jgi:hypothetical protein